MATLDGGDKLTAALADIARAVRRGGTLKVGFLSGATYPDGKPVAMIAAIQNFGAPSRNIPPRPFFSNMITRRSGEWPAVIVEQLRATNLNVPVAMKRIGLLVKGQLQQSIRDTNQPPLAASTIRRKGFDKPLIDTGHMLNSVAFEWEDR